MYKNYKTSKFKAVIIKSKKNLKCTMICFKKKYKIRNCNTNKNLLHKKQKQKKKMKMKNFNKTVWNKFIKMK